MQDAPARVRECTICPPWVIRCTHYGDGSLTLRDYQHPSYLDLYLDEEDGGPHYGVFGAMADMGPYFGDCETNDYDVAVLVFEHAERQLLGDEA